MEQAFTFHRQRQSECLSAAYIPVVCAYGSCSLPGVIDYCSSVELLFGFPLYCAKGLACTGLCSGQTPAWFSGTHSGSHVCVSAEVHCFLPPAGASVLGCLMVRLTFGHSAHPRYGSCMLYCTLSLKHLFVGDLEAWVVK